MPGKRLVELREELTAKQTKLKEALDQAGPEMDFSKIEYLEGKTTSDKVLSFKSKNTELDDLAKKIEDEVALEAAADSVKARERLLERTKGTATLPLPASNVEQKSIGEMFTESDAYKKRDSHGGPSSMLDVDLKTTMTTAAGFAPQAIRTGRIVEYAQRPIQVMDIVPGGTTDQSAVVYMEETTSTSNAAEATESSGAYGEAAFAFTERTSTVRKIAVNIPVTQEQLEDVPGIQSFLNMRLQFFLRQRFDYQIVNGNGSAPNLSGILAATGIQTFALAGDKFDAIYDAAKRVRVTGRSQPNALVIHSNDWQDIRLMRTSDGLYILGNPNEPGPGRIWGLTVVENEVITEGTTLVGDFANQIMSFEKRGIEIDITDSHASEFIYGILRIRASFRVALAIWRPAGFCYITGM